MGQSDMGVHPLDGSGEAEVSRPRAPRMGGDSVEGLALRAMSEEQRWLSARPREQSMKLILSSGSLAAYGEMSLKEMKDKRANLKSSVAFRAKGKEDVSKDRETIQILDHLIVIKEAENAVTEGTLENKSPEELTKILLSVLTVCSHSETSEALKDVCLKILDRFADVPEKTGAEILKRMALSGSTLDVNEEKGTIALNGSTLNVIDLSVKVVKDQKTGGEKAGKIMTSFITFLRNGVTKLVSEQSLSSLSVGSKVIQGIKYIEGERVVNKLAFEQINKIITKRVSDACAEIDKALGKTHLSPKEKKALLGKIEILAELISEEALGTLEKFLQRIAIVSEELPDVKDAYAKAQEALAIRKSGGESIKPFSGAVGIVKSQLGKLDRFLGRVHLLSHIRPQRAIQTGEVILMRLQRARQELPEVLDESTVGKVEALKKEIEMLNNDSLFRQILQTDEEMQATFIKIQKDSKWAMELSKIKERSRRENISLSDQVQIAQDLKKLIEEFGPEWTARDWANDEIFKTYDPLSVLQVIGRKINTIESMSIQEILAFQNEMQKIEKIWLFKGDSYKAAFTDFKSRVDIRCSDERLKDVTSFEDLQKLLSEPWFRVVLQNSDVKKRLEEKICSLMKDADLSAIVQNPAVKVYIEKSDNVQIKQMYDEALRRFANKISDAPSFDSLSEVLRGPVFKAVSATQEVKTALRKKITTLLQGVQTFKDLERLAHNEDLMKIVNKEAATEYGNVCKRVVEPMVISAQSFADLDKVFGKGLFATISGDIRSALKVKILLLLVNPSPEDLKIFSENVQLQDIVENDPDISVAYKMACETKAMDLLQKPVSGADLSELLGQNWFKTACEVDKVKKNLYLVVRKIIVTCSRDDLKTLTQLPMFQNILADSDMKEIYINRCAIVAREELGKIKETATETIEVLYTLQREEWFLAVLAEKDDLRKMNCESLEKAFGKSGLPPSLKGIMQKLNEMQKNPSLKGIEELADLFVSTENDLSGIEQYTALRLAFQMFQCLLDAHPKKYSTIQVKLKDTLCVSSSAFDRAIGRAHLGGSIPKELTRSTIGQAIQHVFVAPYYGTILPSPEDIVIFDPEKGKLTKWSNMPFEQKKDLLLKNAKSVGEKDIAARAVDERELDILLDSSSSSFCETDPRKDHGSDHAVRTAIFVPIFAYLYEKYLDIPFPSEQDLVVAQFTAAGHDSGRQAEGVDVFDGSSSNTVERALRDVGVSDSQVLERSKVAISEKDSEDLQHKELIAKLVQNVDSVEYRRLGGDSSDIGPGFEESRKYLDIFKELSTSSRQAEGTTELDELRREMNKLIKATNKQEFREKASQVGKNYYEEILSQITQDEYPRLYKILSEKGVIPSAASTGAQ
jgi:hypothetical protein